MHLVYCCLLFDFAGFGLLLGGFGFDGGLRWLFVFGLIFCVLVIFGGLSVFGLVCDALIISGWFYCVVSNLLDVGLWCLLYLCLLFDFACLDFWFI